MGVKALVELFSTQLIKVGNSYGFLVPMEIVKKEKLKLKDEIQVTVMKKDRSDLLKYWGIAKNVKTKFERDKSVREF